MMARAGVVIGLAGWSVAALLTLPVLAGDADPIFADGFEIRGCAPTPPSTLTADVRDYGALGDGQTDDTAAIQAAIDAIAGTDGTVEVPAGDYRIDVRHNGWQGGLMLGSRMTLRLAPGAVLRALPTAAESYSVLSVMGRTDVNIVGGTIVGERHEHLGSAGEWGFGIDIRTSHRIVLEDVEVREAWGDGVYIGYPFDKDPVINEDIRICGLTAADNRRQGMSISEGRRIHITDSTFADTRGTNPQRGIDIEPDGDAVVEEVLIERSRFLGNVGGGFQAGVPWSAPEAIVRDVVFRDNYLESNGRAPGDPPNAESRNGSAIYLANVNGTQIVGNTVLDTLGRGILLVDGATNTVVEGNHVEGTRQGDNAGENGNGIEIGVAGGSRITGNTVINNEGHGIWLIWPDASVEIHDNIVYGNGQEP